MRKIILTLALLIVAFPALAKDIIVTVEGMSCESCAETVKQSFDKRENLSNVDIDVEHGLVTLHLNDDQTINDEAIKAVIDYAGYKTVEIKR